jgi:hypothetical protein
MSGKTYVRVLGHVCACKAASVRSFSHVSILACFVRTDSLNKVIDNRAYNRALAKSAATEQKEDRGTFVYTWGAGYHGQLGRKGARGQKKYAVVPVMIELIKATRQVACGGLHSAALTGACFLLAFGLSSMSVLSSFFGAYFF